MLAERDALIQQLADLQGRTVEDVRAFMATGNDTPAGLSYLIREVRQRIWQVQADLATEAARERELEEGQKAVSAWTPTLEGFNPRHLPEAVSDDPRPFYIDVRGVDASYSRPCRGVARPYEARVLIRRTSNGPVLAEPDGEA